MQVQDSQQNYYKCECGEIHTGKFCPNCGRQRKEQESFTCECGYSGPISNFCPNCGHQIIRQELPPPVLTPMPTPEAIKPSEPKEKPGWKCQQCGAENQMDKCTVCGKEIKPVILFSISTYMSTNPPVHTSTIIYEYSDTELLMDDNGKRRLISADVIGPAMEIIRNNKLDDPDFKDPAAMGIVGGSVSIAFKDGDKYIQASLQTHGFMVTKAQYALMELFNKA